MHRKLTEAETCPKNNILSTQGKNALFINISNTLILKSTQLILKAIGSSLVLKYLDEMKQTFFDA